MPLMSSCRNSVASRFCRSDGDSPGVGLLSGSGRVYVYQLPTHISILERTDTLDGAEVLPGFRLPIVRVYDAVSKPA